MLKGIKFLTWGIFNYIFIMQIYGMSESGFDYSLSINSVVDSH